MFRLFAVLGCALVLSACISSAPVQPPRGLLFTNQQAPLMTDFDETRLGPKHGKASVRYFRDPLFTGLDFAWDDACLRAAAKNGNITTVRHADYEFLSILGIFARFTVHAYGD
jgi:hypothetical protein